MEFKAILGYRVRHCLKKIKLKTNQSNKKSPKVAEKDLGENKS